VEMKRGRFAKEGLIQYRIVCQQVNVASLEEVRGMPHPSPSPPRAPTFHRHMPPCILNRTVPERIRRRRRAHPKRRWLGQAAIYLRNRSETLCGHLTHE
jgi:hypothetical protein